MPQMIFRVADQPTPDTNDDQYVTRTATTYAGLTSAAPARALNTVTVLTARTWNGTNYVVRNSLLRFDTSGLPDTATVTAATLRVTPSAKTDGADALSLVGEWYLLDGTNTDSTVTPSSTAFAGITLASITVNTATTAPFLDIALLAPTSVSKTGNTGIRLHITQLAADAAPTAVNDLQVRSYDYDVTNSLTGEASRKARLVVDYTTGETLRPDAILVQTNDTKTLTDLQRDVP